MKKEKKKIQKIKAESHLLGFNDGVRETLRKLGKEFEPLETLLVGNEK